LSIAFVCLCHRNQIGSEFAAFIVTVQSTGIFRRFHVANDGIEEVEKRFGLALAKHPPKRSL